MSEEIINEIKWTIHETHPELEVKQAREKLSEVVDPEIGMHIIQLGLVRDISVDNGIGHVKMILTTPFCPYGPVLSTGFCGRALLPRCACEGGCLRLGIPDETCGRDRLCAGAEGSNRPGNSLANGAQEE